MSVWAYAAPLRRVAEILDFCAVYFATLWGRCAVLSVPLLGIALLLRKLVWNRGSFVKGAVWTVFISAPFLGKLRVFYESRACLPLILWQSWCGGYRPVRYGYLLGQPRYGVCDGLSDGQRRRLSAHMRRRRRGAFRALLPDDAPQDGLYGILWGGFLKVPRIGGTINAVYFESPSDGDAVSVEFFDVNDLLYVKLIKLL